MKKIEDISGRIFGDWTALYRDHEAEKKLKEEKGYSKSMWRCKCSACGREKAVRSADLKNGKSKNCGCKKHSSPYNKLKFNRGQRFGKLIVIGESENRKNQKSHWVCKCDCGSIIITTGSRLKSGHTHSCGCIKSKGEELISKLLTQMNIIFEKEKTFSTLVSKYNNIPYRFDFYLPAYNCLIEYDGRQHFEYSNSGWNNKKNFEKTIVRDDIKEQWCKENKIKLLRFSYKEYNNINEEFLRRRINESTGT